MLDGILGAGITPSIRAGFATGGHVEHSQHYQGKGYRLDVTGWSDQQKSDLVTAAINNGGRGIGIYPSGNAIHIDTRDKPDVLGAKRCGQVQRC